MRWWEWAGHLPQTLSEGRHFANAMRCWPTQYIYQTFDAACKAHYECNSFLFSYLNVELMTHKSKDQKVQRSDLDELHWQDRFEEIEVDTGTPLVDTSRKGHISVPFRKSNPSRRELVWRSQKNEMVSLEEIALQFQSFLLTFSTELEFNRCRGRYTTKTAHRCPGYNRIEITLTPDIARSAIVSHLTPIPHEICPVCKEIVKDAEIFACICGRDGKPAPHVHDHSPCVLTSLVDNESIPTIRCSNCSEWHHRPCASISNNNDQSFVCQRCEVQTEDLICPSPVLASRRRKGWFNRRGYVYFILFYLYYWHFDYFI